MSREKQRKVRRSRPNRDQEAPILAPSPAAAQEGDHDNEKTEEEEHGVKTQQVVLRQKRDVALVLDPEPDGNSDYDAAKHLQNILHLYFT